MENFQEYLELIIQYLPYFAIPIVVAGLVQSLKKAFKKFFSTVNGMRLLPFLPVIIGTPLGLALPVDGTWTRLLIGAGLGTASTLLYKIFTVTLAKKLRLEEKQIRKTMDLPEE